MKQVLTLSALLLTTLLSAQYNDKGRVHLSIGGNFGVHATEYHQTVTFLGQSVSESSKGAAATVTMPIEVQVGIARAFSLGLYGEFGNYIDSVASKHNRIAVLGLAPRFYVVNKDRFSWMMGLHLGYTALSIDDVGEPGDPKSSFSGSHFGLNTGLGFLFGETIGLQLQARYLSHSMPLRKHEFLGIEVDPELYKADLRARGLGMQLALHFRF